MNDNQVLNLVPLLDVKKNKWMLVEDKYLHGRLCFFKLIENERYNSLMLQQITYSPPKYQYYLPHEAIQLSVSPTDINFVKLWLNRTTSYYIQSEDTIKLFDEIIFRIFPIKKQMDVNMNIRTYIRLQTLIEEKLRTYYSLVHQQVLNLVPNI